MRRRPCGGGSGCCRVRVCPCGLASRGMARRGAWPAGSRAAPAACLMRPSAALPAQAAPDRAVLVWPGVVCSKAACDVASCAIGHLPPSAHHQQASPPPTARQWRPWLHAAARCQQTDRPAPPSHARPCPAPRCPGTQPWTRSRPSLRHTAPCWMQTSCRPASPARWVRGTAARPACHVASRPSILGCCWRWAALLPPCLLALGSVSPTAGTTPTHVPLCTARLCVRDVRHVG